MPIAPPNNGMWVNGKSKITGVPWDPFLNMDLPQDDSSNPTTPAPNQTGLANLVQLGAVGPSSTIGNLPTYNQLPSYGPQATTDQFQQQGTQPSLGIRPQRRYNRLPQLMSGQFQYY